MYDNSSHRKSCKSCSRKPRTMLVSSTIQLVKVNDAFMCISFRIIPGETERWNSGGHLTRCIVPIIDKLSFSSRLCYVLSELRWSIRQHLSFRWISLMQEPLVGFLAVYEDKKLRWTGESEDHTRSLQEKIYQVEDRTKQWRHLGGQDRTCEGSVSRESGGFGKQDRAVEAGESGYTWSVGQETNADHLFISKAMIGSNPNRGYLSRKTYIPNPYYLRMDF